jgi:hypothetical protein
VIFGSTLRCTILTIAACVSACQSEQGEDTARRDDPDTECHYFLSADRDWYDANGDPYHRFIVDLTRRAARNDMRELPVGRGTDWHISLPCNDHDRLSGLDAYPIVIEAETRADYERAYLEWQLNNRQGALTDRN